MSLILNIDTAVDSGSVSLSQQNDLLKFRINNNQKEHAAWIHSAIAEMMEEAGCTIQDLNAIAVSNGPGSYTGLRIGLSAAKGLCFALQIPLIAIGTLEIMAAAAIHNASADLIKKADWLCPMIDARRMEVFFAIFDRQLLMIHKPQAAIIDHDTFAGFLENKKVLFFGNGSSKLKNHLPGDNAIFADFVQNGAVEMIPLSFSYYQQKKFSDLAYAEPLYIKEFYTHPRK